MNLTQLQLEYVELLDSITPDNPEEHQAIIRQLDRNTAQQERYLVQYDY